LNISEYLNIIYQHRGKVIGTTFAVVLAVILFSFLQKPVYKSTAVLEYQETNQANSYINGIDLPTQFNQPERQLSTQAELLTSKPLANKVIKNHHLKITAEEFIRRLTTTFDDKTNLIQVTFEDNDPKEAQAVTATLVQYFLEQSKNSATAEVSKAKNEVSYKMRDIQEDIQLYSSLTNSNNNPANQGKGNNNAGIKSQIAIATSIYTDLAAKFQQLKIMEDLSSGGLKMAIPATLPSRPFKPNILNNLIIAFILGFSSSITWIFTDEYFDNTIKNNEDIEKYFKLPLLGQIPLTDTGDDLSNKNKQPIKRRTKLVSHNSHAGEAYRAVRTNIQFLNFDNKTKTIVVTSPTAGEGKTTISTNLASTLALSGGKIMLIDCDLRHPQVHKALNLENLVGLSSVLVKSNYINEAIQKTNVPEFSVITSGPLPPNPSELLGSKRMADLLEVVKEEFDYIIIDTPPVCAVTDAAVLAQKVDGVILVCSINSTLRETAIESRKIFMNVKSRLLGVVGNKFDVKSRYGYYSKYYGHYYYGGQANEDERNEERAS